MRRSTVTQHSTANDSAQQFLRGFFNHTNTVENYLSILKRGIVDVGT